MKTSTKQIAMISVFASLYSIASFLPISIYIGGEGLITLNIVILPVIAYLFDPIYAATTAFIGALVMLFTGASITPVYGWLTPLIPLAGGLLGSISKKTSLGSVFFMIIGFISFIVYSGGTLIWTMFYVFPMVTALLRRRSVRFQILNICVTTTICELISMDLGSIFLLGFPSFLWTLILPFAIYERAVAIFGSFALINIFRRYLPSFKSIS